MKRSYKSQRNYSRITEPRTAAATLIPAERAWKAFLLKHPISIFKVRECVHCFNGIKFKCMH